MGLATLITVTAGCSTVPAQPKSVPTTTANTVPVKSSASHPWRVEAASFIDPLHGWVLGRAGCKDCAALRKTEDGGLRWTVLPAPRIAVAWYSASAQAVDDVLFVNRRDGYLFGRRSFVTSDGGYHWRRLGLPDVTQMVSADGLVYALAVARHRAVTLWSSTSGETHWLSVSLPLGAKPSAIAVEGGTLALLQAGGQLAVRGEQPGRLWVSRDGGATWSARPVPCVVARDGGAQVMSIALDHAYSFLIDCYNNRQSSQQLVTAHHLYGSSDSGRTWRRLGNPTHSGSPVLMAGNGAGHAVITTESGAHDNLDVSTDGAIRWRRVFSDGGDFSGWNDLRFLTAKVGFVVGPTHYARTRLYRTTSGGRAWRVVPIASNTVANRSISSLPGVGAPGFPSSGYPAPRSGGGGSIPACPSPAEVGPFNAYARSQAVREWRTIGTRTFGYDLRHTDRAWWSVIQTDWRDNPGPYPPRVERLGKPLYAGSLRDEPATLGPSGQYGLLADYCGSQVARRSFAVVGGVADRPALQGLSVFIARAGHPLLYYQYP